MTINAFFKKAVQNSVPADDAKLLAAAAKEFGWDLETTVKHARYPAQFRSIARKEAKLRAELAPMLKIAAK